MKNGEFKNKILSFIMMLAFLFSSVVPISGNAGQIPSEVLFYDSFDGYGVKHFVTHGEDAWTGDSFFSESAWAPDTRNFLILEEDKERKSMVMYLGVSPGTKDSRDDGYIYKSVPIT